MCRDHFRNFRRRKPQAVPEQRSVTKAPQEQTKGYLLTQLADLTKEIDSKLDIVDKKTALQSTFASRRWFLTERASCVDDAITIRELVDVMKSILHPALVRSVLMVMLVCV